MIFSLFAGYIYAIGICKKLTAIQVLPFILLLLIRAFNFRKFIGVILGFALMSFVILITPFMANSSRLNDMIFQPELKEDSINRGVATFWPLVDVDGKGKSRIILEYQEYRVSVQDFALHIWLLIIGIFVLKEGNYLRNIRNFGFLKEKLSPFNIFSLITISSMTYYLFFTKMHSRYMHTAIIFSIAMLVSYYGKSAFVKFFYIVVLLNLSYFLNQMYILGNPEIAWVRSFLDILKLNILI